MEAGWLSSSPVKASRSMYGDETEDRKGLLSWPVQSTFSPQESIEQAKDSLQISTEKKPSGSSSSCRLFGFDLSVPPKADLAQGPVTLSDVLFHSSIEGQVPSALSAGLSDFKSDLSKDCKDQGILQVSPKEVQSKQNTSTRSRTKVQLIF